MTAPIPDRTTTSSESDYSPAAQPDGAEVERHSQQAAPDHPEPSPNSEAARYRVKLREAEAQRDALTERITGYQRRECEGAVADLLDDPTDLWTIGQADMTGFYNDDGELDDAELRAAAGALIEQRPKLAKERGPSHQNFGQFAAKPPPQQMGWSSVIKTV